MTVVSTNKLGLTTTLTTASDRCINNLPAFAAPLLKGISDHMG